MEEEIAVRTFGPNGNSDHTILNKAACHDQRSAIAFGAARGSRASARNTMMASGRFCVAVRHGPPAIASRDGTAERVLAEAEPFAHFRKWHFSDMPHRAYDVR